MIYSIMRRNSSRGSQATVSGKATSYRTPLRSKVVLRTFMPRSRCSEQSILRLCLQLRLTMVETSSLRRVTVPASTRAIQEQTRHRCLTRIQRWRTTLRAMDQRAYPTQVLCICTMPTLYRMSTASLQSIKLPRQDRNPVCLIHREQFPSLEIGHRRIAISSTI